MATLYTYSLFICTCNVNFFFIALCHSMLLFPQNVHLRTFSPLVSVSDLAQHETPWRSVKGDFMNVGLFTIPGRSEMAPRGLSKYTHLNDGTIDLALVKETERKEFIRLIKRLGNNKDQVICIHYVVFD